MHLFEKTQEDTASCKSPACGALFFNPTCKSLFMKMFVLTGLLTFSGILYAGNSDGQDLDKITLSLDLKHVPLKTAFREIEKRTPVRFTYKSYEVDGYDSISCHSRNKSLSNILKNLLKSTDLVYEQVNMNVIVKKKDPPPDIPIQDETIQGTVYDENRQPLPGVSVQVKDSGAGASTDENGRYSLEVPAPAGEKILVFSFLGHLTQEIRVDDRSTIDVVMEEDVAGLGEVVVVGYGTQKKINLTGAVATVSGEDLIRRPVTNPGSMIQGLMPGVQVVQNSGEPGNEGINIRVRGVGTFSSAPDPLVLIDGVQGQLSDLNPNDIENVSVLKDAASASIYGSQAANGVILVTTKKGQEGKVRMEYSGNYATYTPTKLFDLITNSAEYMELFNEARINSGLTSGLYTDEMINAYRNATDRNLYPNTDWLDLLFNPAPTQNHNLSFSGGNNGTTFNVSLGHVNQEGIMKGFDYKKYNIRVNLGSRVNDHIKFGGNLYAKKGETTAPRQGSTDTFLAAMSQAPTYSPQLPDGSGRYAFKSYDFESNNKNPIAIIENEVNRNTDDYTISAQGWVDIQLLKSLNWYTKAAFNLDISKYDDFRPQIPLYNFHTGEFMTDLDVGGSGLIVQDDQTVYKNLYTYLNFNEEFGNGHHVNLQAGYSAEDNTYEYLNGYRQNYPSDLLRQLDAGSPSVQRATGTKQEWALMSFFGRLGYNYHERYLFEANLRYDGSSRISPDSRWGAFPSFSAGWRVTEEQFIKDLDLNWLNELKFRGSYGELGNQNIGLYPYQSILELTGNYSFDDTNLSPGAAQTALSNADIKWEATSITDFGLDLTVFNGLNVTFDWYKKRTKDILRNSQVTGAVGLSPPTVNNGTMENTGIELGLQYTNRIGAGLFSGLAYKAGFNIDHYKNELVGFGEREIDGYALREEGLEWDAYYMLEWTGIFQSEQEIVNSPRQFSDETVPGDLKFKDQNGDGVINNDDRVPMSGRYPSFNYSLNMAATWKGFDFAVQFQGVEGVKYFVDNWGTIPFVQGSPPTTNWRDRWTENNPSTTMPRIYWGWGAPQRISRFSSWFLQDGSYLRLKNLTLGYTLPANLTQRFRVERLRVYFSGDNLITITDYPGLDPERGGSGSFVNYPQNRIYSFGVNVGF